LVQGTAKIHSLVPIQLPTSQAREVGLFESEMNSQAQCQRGHNVKQSSPKKKHRVVTRHIEDEMYWVVKNEMMERLRLAAPESLVNVSTVSEQKLVEEVHAYVMYKVTKCLRSGDTTFAEPCKLQQFARQLVRAWCSSHLTVSRRKTHCAKNAQQSKLDPSIHYTSKQIHKMVIDEILTTGIRPWDGNSGGGSSSQGDQWQHSRNREQVGQPDSIVCKQCKQVSDFAHHLPESSPNSHSKAVKKERIPKVVQFILRFISGPKAAKVTSELSSE